MVIAVAAHEVGTGRRTIEHQIDVFLLDVGTFGAFIQMKSPTRNRRALFDVAVAGPLAGLVVAIPALLIGLQTTEVLPPNAEPASAMMGHGTSAGSSLLFALISKIALGDQLQDGYLLQLSPLAFAGWLGLFDMGRPAVSGIGCE